MIILKRLYSETKLFDEITFKLGINIILGRYSNNEKREGINGIGKSSVVRLIDLVFLGEGSKKHFLTNKYAFFEGHSFTLEFEVNEKNYSIKRLFKGEKMPTWFMQESESYQDIEEKELKIKLTNLFFLTDITDCFVENTWFRDLIRFFVKDDINRQGRTNPIDFISDGKFKPSDISLFYKNFFLLGLPNAKLFEYEQIEKRLKEKKGYKRELIKDIEQTTNNKIEHFKSQQFEIEKEISLLEKATQDYHFMPKYELAEKELAVLENLISTKLLLRNKLLKEKENYEKSFRINLEADIQKVEKIYKEIHKELAVFVKNTLTEVIDFRKAISTNRKSFLQKRQTAIKEDLEKLFQEISSLEIQRRKIYKMFDEKKALDSLKNAYQDLITKKTELEKSKINLQKISELEIEISKIDTELKEVKTQIVEIVQGMESSIKEIRALFYEVLENSIYFDEDKKGFVFEITNSDKGVPIKFEVDVPKSGSKGNQFFKLMAYDLTVFLNIIRQNRNIVSFLIHDGVYDEIEPAKTIKILNYIYQQTLKYPNFQYIIAANQFELDISEEDKLRVGNYEFDLYENVVAVFEDTDNKMFFKKSFS